MATFCFAGYPVENGERAAKFYGDLFGWEFMPYGERADTTLFQTKNLKGEQGLPGGFMPKAQVPGPLNYIEVDDIDGMAKKVADAGGQVLTPKIPVPTMGWMYHCIDTEGNPFGLWQGDPEAK